MGTASGSSCSAKKDYTHTWELLSTSAVMYFWQLSREAHSAVPRWRGGAHFFCAMQASDFCSLRVSTVQSFCTPYLPVQATSMQPLNPHKYPMTVCLCCVRKREVAALT